jgi:hypothetical protein
VHTPQRKLTILELNKEYQQVEGEALENVLSRLGFRGWEDQSMNQAFYDTFRWNFTRNAHNTYVMPVINEGNAHIFKTVKNTKNSKRG